MSDDGAVAGPTVGDHPVVIAILRVLEPVAIGRNHAIRIALPRPAQIDDIAEMYDQVDRIIHVFAFHRVGHLKLRAGVFAFVTGPACAAGARVAQRQKAERIAHCG